MRAPFQYDFVLRDHHSQAMSVCCPIDSDCVEYDGPCVLSIFLAPLAFYLFLMY